MRGRCAGALHAGINVEIGSFDLTFARTFLFTNRYRTDCVPHRAIGAAPYPSDFLLNCIQHVSGLCILLQQVSKLFSQCLAIHLSSVICISEGASIDYYSSHSHQEESMNRFRMEAEVTQENC